LQRESPGRALAVRRHVPVCHESFLIKDGSTKKYVNIFDPLKSYHSLQEIIDNYPDGVDPRDMAWMLNRMLGALLFAHQNNVVHGAILPCHIMLRMEDRNGVLIDWSYSAKRGEKISAICPNYLEYYPVDILDGKPASYGQDLYMLAMCMVRLLGGNLGKKSIPASVPKQIAGLLKACLLNYKQRSDDAFELFEDFQKVLTALYGKRKFREFIMPRK